MSSTQESEIEITVTSEQLGDDSYVKRMLVETKLKVLKEISDASGCDFNTKVVDLCPEVTQYEDLISKYNITITKSSSNQASKVKFSRKKKLSGKKTVSPLDDVPTPTVVPVTEEPSSPASNEASSPPVVVPVTEEPSSPTSDEASSTPVVVPITEEPSSPASNEASSTPVVVPVTKKTSTKIKKKKKIVSKAKK